MGHCIRAIIGTQSGIRKLVEDWRTVETDLPQGYGMVFLTDALLNNLAELFESGDEPSDPEAVNRWLLEKYSFRTKLACIETDYFGGSGTQWGVLYEDGTLRIGPIRGEGAINTLLRELGVWRAPGRDEFDSLNLQKYRRMPD